MSLVSRLGLSTSTALAVGLSSSGYFLFANMGMTTYGVLPAIETIKVDPGKAVALWAFLYETAATRYEHSLLTLSLMSNIQHLRGTRDRYVSTGAIAAEEAEDSWRRMQKWKKQHLVRVGLSFASYVVGIAAVFQLA
ncbi:hypothetical protein HDZ31DRAFT_35702 [Schizophyllum fasciatum]